MHIFDIICTAIIVAYIVIIGACYLSALTAYRNFDGNRFQTQAAGAWALSLAASGTFILPRKLMLLNVLWFVGTVYFLPYQAFAGAALLLFVYGLHLHAKRITHKPNYRFSL